jgi:hypothetical protein
MYDLTFADIMIFHTLTDNEAAAENYLQCDDPLFEEQFELS